MSAPPATLGTRPASRSADRPRRVLFVHGTLEIGGAEQVRLTLLEHLDRTRYQAAVCCLQAGGPIAREVAALGYPVHVLGHRAHALSLPTLTSLRRVIREWRPHIVQTSLPRANYWGRIAAALESAPVVVVEEHSVRENADWARPALERFLGPRTDCALVVSNAVLRAVAGADPASARRRSEVIPNPVNARRLRPLRPPREVRAELDLPKRARLVVHAGRMDGARGLKGQDILIQAIAQLPPGSPDMMFALIGDGPGRPALESLARELGVSDRLRFPGWRRDIADFLAAADLFAFPSRREGMPVALMEAMWMGLPIIASDLPANREVLQEGECGRLVSPESPAALAAALAELARDRETARGLAARACAHARTHYSPECYARAVTDLWDRLLEEKQRDASARAVQPQEDSR